MKPSYTLADLAGAAHAWEIGGCQGLGLWFTQHKALCGGDYGALVRAVRRYLGDTIDYSKVSPSAGCLSPVGVKRVSGTAKDAEDDAAESDA